MARPSPFLVLTPHDLYACLSGTLATPPEEQKFAAVKFDLTSIRGVRQIGKREYVFDFNDGRAMSTKIGFRHGRSGLRGVVAFLKTLHSLVPGAQWDPSP
jgi:hypothetical protein